MKDKGDEVGCHGTGIRKFTSNINCCESVVGCASVLAPNLLLRVYWKEFEHKEIVNWQRYDHSLDFLIIQSDG